MDYTPEQLKKIKLLKEAVQNKQQAQLLEYQEEIIKVLKTIGIKFDERFQAEHLKKIIVDYIEVKAPDETKIDWENMPSQEKIEVIKNVLVDWENMPKTEITVEKVNLNPLVKAFKAAETALEKMGKTIISTLNRMLFFLSEPDEVVVKNNQIIEIYGKRTVTYSITRDSKGKISRWVRDER